MSTDPEHRFELALQLGELKIGYQLAVEAEVRAANQLTLNQGQHRLIKKNMFMPRVRFSIVFFLSSLSKSGSSWQSWLSASVSLAWHRSAFITPRTMEACCCWLQPLATPLWWANWLKVLNGMARTTLPLWLTSCRESEYLNSYICKKCWSWHTKQVPKSRRMTDISI